MKNLIKIEEAAMLAICLLALFQLEVPFWWYLLLFLGPDISMLGYLGGNQTGAFFYNLFHHKALALALGVAGWMLPLQELLLTGIVLLGHSSMDRIFGYGLKTTQGFKFTHLGIIGKKIS